MPSYMLALVQGRPHLLAVQDTAPHLPSYVLQEWARACMLSSANSRVMPAAVKQAAMAQGTDSALFRCCMAGRFLAGVLRADVWPECKW